MKIAVYGLDVVEDVEIGKKAREIGRQIARRGHTLVTAACRGYPQEAVLGAREFDGECIGYSPAVELDRHKEYGLPVDGFSKLVFLPENHGDDFIIRCKYRDVFLDADAQGAIVIGGDISTMGQFALASFSDSCRPLGILNESGGITKNAIDALLRVEDEEPEGVGAKIIRHTDPVLLVAEVIGMFSEDL